MHIFTRPGTLLFVFSCFAFSLKAQVNCGLKDTDLPAHVIASMQMAPAWEQARKARKTNGPAPFYVCRLAVDIDAETYLNFNSDSVYIHNELLKTIDNASRFFERDAGIALELVYVHLTKDPAKDPNHKQPGYSRLGSLLSRWPQSLLKEKNIDVMMHLSVHYYGDVSGIASGIGSAYNVSPWGSLTTILHELGHNFGSPHTQSCFWPGGPLEFCVSAEGNCKNGELLYQEELGTIMGYCNNNQTFHPLSSALMENYAKNNFPQISSAPPTPNLAADQVLPNKPVVVFSPVLGAEEYDFEISENQNFSSIYHKGTTSTNRFSVADLPAGKKFYFRIKAANRFGKSAWSEAKELDLTGISLLSPKIESVYTHADHKEYKKASDGYVIIPISPRSPADSYQLEIHNPFFSNGGQQPNFSGMIPGSAREFKVDIRNLYIPPFFSIRVRAYRNGQHSEWSEMVTESFDETNETVDLFFNNHTRMPLNFPAYSYGEFPSGALTYQLIDNETAAVVKEVSYDYYPSVGTPPGIMLQDLKPNTSYTLWRLHSNTWIRNWHNFGDTLKLKTKIDFTTGNGNNAKKYEFFNHENSPGIGFNVSPPLFYQNQVITTHMRGTTLWESKNPSRFKEYTRANTGGNIANFSVANALDAKNGWYYQLNKVNSLSESYMLSQYDLENNFALTNASLVQWPHSDWPIWVSKSGDFIGGRNGIYKPYHQYWALQTGLQQVTKYKEWENYIYFTYYHSSNGYRVGRYDKILNTVTEVGPYRDFDMDREGRLHLLNMNRHYIGPDKGVISSREYAAIATDQWGYTYLMQENPNNLTFYKYKEKEQVDEVILPGTNPYFQNQIYVDNQGNIWYEKHENSYLKVNLCDINAPQKVALTQRGDTQVLIAEGCTSTLWRWKASSGRPIEQFSSGNELIVSESETTYFVRCHLNGCSSEEVSTDLLYQPEVLSFSFEKEKMCRNSSAVLLIVTRGKFPETTPFFIQIFDHTNQQVEDAQLGQWGRSHRFWLDLPVGKYTARVRAEGYENADGFSAAFTVEELPQIILSQKPVIGGVELSIPEWEGVNYEWLEDGTILAGATTSKIFTNKPLVYVGIIYNAVCESHSQEHQVELPLGLERNDFTVMVHENPNPEGKYKFTVVKPLDEIILVHVLDNQGKLVLRKKHTNSIPGAEIWVDLNGFPPATYTVKFESGNAETSLKVVKL